MPFKGSYIRCILLSNNYTCVVDDNYEMLNSQELGGMQKEKIAPFGCRLVQLLYLLKQYLKRIQTAQPNSKVVQDLGTSVSYSK